MDGYMGQIIAVGFNFAQQGWSLCQGQILAISSNTALFALLGTTYGGDGQTTFALPDLRGRTIVGAGQGPGLSNIDQGEMAGNESVTLGTSQMTAHNHTCTATSAVNAMRAAATASNPAGNLMAGKVMWVPPAVPPAVVQLAPAAVTTTATLGASGQSMPVDILNPYLGVNIQICVEGIFPSRN